MMPADTWLVALDVDGTILLEDETMSPGVPAAIGRLRDAGHVVTLATGRSWAAPAGIWRRSGSSRSTWCARTAP
ncbi:HAD family hydrolase [Microbacterium sp. KUDC0406]|uniref:HAD family hydrolase n=1 Tax=Microbacterium sp. KUDC0406 TaxID=2909588 RepID=UPI002E345E50|nr:HAD hydrolase family protein [Microbacterium sp. KUDC0406]